MPRRPSNHVDSPAAVGERLRAARLAAGLSQRDLSFDGCTAAYVSRIEAGARTPSYQILREFGKRLGVSADYLATGEEGILAADPLVEGTIALRLGDPDRAAEVYERHLRESDDERAAAQADAGLGRVALARGDAHEAVERLSRALAADGLSTAEASAAATRCGVSSTRRSRSSGASSSARGSGATVSTRRASRCCSRTRTWTAGTRPRARPRSKTRSPAPPTCSTPRFAPTSTGRSRVSPGPRASPTSRPSMPSSPSRRRARASMRPPRRGRCC